NPTRFKRKLETATPAAAHRSRDPAPEKPRPLHQHQSCGIPPLPQIEPQEIRAQSRNPPKSEILLQFQRLKILQSRINRLLREHRPFSLYKLAKIFLPVPRVASCRPLLRQKLRVDPRTIRRRHPDPHPPVSSVSPLFVEEPA